MIRSFFLQLKQSYIQSLFLKVRQCFPSSSSSYLLFYLVFVLGGLILATGCNHKLEQTSKQSNKVEKTPLPSSKSNYIGVWESNLKNAPSKNSFWGTGNNYVLLGIKKDSTIVYANNQPDLCLTYRSIITKINDSEIKTLAEFPDWYPADSQLKINQSPHQKKGQWKMIVNGNELYRTKSKMEKKLKFKCSAGNLKQISP